MTNLQPVVFMQYDRTHRHNAAARETECIHGVQNAELGDSLYKYLYPDGVESVNRFLGGGRSLPQQ